MSPETEIKIKKISRYLYIYASMLVIGLVWSIADGEIENIRNFIRGIIRFVVMIYLSKTIWKLQKFNWWAMVFSTAFFGVFGVLAVVVGLVGGGVYESCQLLYIGLISIPATVVLAKAFLLVVQRDVKLQFIN